MTRFRPLLLLAALVAPLSACDSGGSTAGLVARAAGHELSVGDAVRLLAPETQLPNQREVALALADLWVDYTLLATASAGDTTMTSVDVSPLVQRQVEQEKIMALRDTVIQVDTALTEAELREIFERDAPGTEVRARHILLTWPEQATDEQRDSVRAAAEDLRRRAGEGEDFAALAEEFSQDPGSAGEGGDLGYFGRGSMVRPFEEAAFSLEPGELSEVVETPYGYHVIKVEDRRSPSYEEAGPNFRQSVQQRRFVEAESTFVAQIRESAAPEVADDAVDVVKGLAENPTSRVTPRAAGRALVEYEGGALTVGEVREFLQGRPPQFRAQVSAAQDEQIEQGILMALANQELLVAEAERRGIEVPEARQDSMAENARAGFREAARRLGLLQIEAEPGETEEQAVELAVENLLQRILRGEQDVIPLGPVSFALRQQYESQVFDSGIDRVVERVEEVRGPQVPQTPGGLPGAQPPGQAPGAQPSTPGGQTPAPAPAPGDTSGGD